jgi:hypothetical protein
LPERTPVIAWRINEVHTKPQSYYEEGMIAISTHLTSAGQAGNGRYAVRHPDGVVSRYQDDQTWKDVEEWMEWVREDLRWNGKRRAAE